MIRRVPCEAQPGTHVLFHATELAPVMCIRMCVCVCVCPYVLCWCVSESVRVCCIGEGEREERGRAKQQERLREMDRDELSEQECSARHILRAHPTSPWSNQIRKQGWWTLWCSLVVKSPHGLPVPVPRHVSMATQSYRENE